MGFPSSTGWKVAPLHFRLLLHLWNDPVGICPRVPPDAGDLPRHSHAGAPSRDPELVAADLVRDEDGRVPPDGRELVTKVAVQRLEVVWKDDHRLAPAVQINHAIVDVLHIR